MNTASGGSGNNNMEGTPATFKNNPSSNPHSSSPYVSLASMSLPNKMNQESLYNSVPHSASGDQTSNYISHNNIFPPAMNPNPIPVISQPSINNEHQDLSDPFVVTVRNSPAKISKSNSSSFLGRTPPVVKTGPKLALYRSNSSLDLLDRENYYTHHNYHRASINDALVHQQQQQQHQQQQLSPQHIQLARLQHQNLTSQKSTPLKESYTTGCFTRRKDFGSHGSIDVLSNANTFMNMNNPSNSPVATTSSTGGHNLIPMKTERSASLSVNTPHFLSLVASTVNNRRGSFDVIGGGNDNNYPGKNPKSSADIINLKETSSPRLRLKFQKLWEHKDKDKSSTGISDGKSDSSSLTSLKGPSASSTTTTTKQEASIFKKLRGGNSKVTSQNNPSCNNDQNDGNAGGKIQLRNNGTNSNQIEERYRRRVFAHYDCQSVSSNISYAVKLRSILEKRRNTTTGASAASQRISSPPNSSLNNIANTVSSSLNECQQNSSSPLPDDLGDGLSNQLLLSCPYFRNEVGGEGERIVSLCRSKKFGGSIAGSKVGCGDGPNIPTNIPGGRESSIRVNSQTFEETHHRSQQARSLSILEFNGSTHWNKGKCPLQSNKASTLEAVDLGASYYKDYFYRQDHENWFGSDEILGPLAISIRRVKLEQQQQQSNLPCPDGKEGTPPPNQKYMYRLIVRNVELFTLRGSILEENVPNIKQPNSHKGSCHSKEVIEFLLPEIQLSCLKQGIQSLNTEDQLLKLDTQILTHRHKVGVMYCKAGQGSSEEEMYNNEDAGDSFNEFLDLIGNRIRLKGFDKYAGGLDTKDDSTGLYSVYAQHQDCEVIFHISSLLPFTPNNRQQLMRKRHIGNDIVTIVFQEQGALPFTPKNIRSQFQHVFIVVRVFNPNTDNTYYKVGITRSKEVPLFGPRIPEGGKFFKNQEFVDFLLSKVINAEIATYRSEKFTTMATRTRQEYLKDLVTNYSTTTSIDPRPKFSILPFGHKKKEMIPPKKFNLDPCLNGANSWSVYLDDNSMDNCEIDSYLAISTDSFVIIDVKSREPLFAIPCSSILGWAATINSLKVYYHQGECVRIFSKEATTMIGSGGENEDILEIIAKLEHVTNGCETQEYTLHRNEIGQLGFHVQQDGVVTEVEPLGYAAKTGLKQGSRLVEICKVAVCTLSQEQMIDFLKSSNTVVISVVSPHLDGSVRRGCDRHHCMLDNQQELGDYENLNLNPTEAIKVKNNGSPSLIHQFKAPLVNNPNNSHLAQQAVPGNHRKRYNETRSFSPPRSSNSSGYGTGSSSKSFGDPNFSHLISEVEPLTNPSTSNGVSSNSIWYDLPENVEDSGVKGKVPPPTNMSNENHSPPPIPARSANNQQFVTPIRNPNTIVVNNYKNAFLNGNGVYVSSNPTSSTTSADTFLAKRDFFQRNNSHGSFHNRLSPSRSQDLLNLRPLHLRPFPSLDPDQFDLSPPTGLSRERGVGYGYDDDGGIYQLATKNGHHHSAFTSSTTPHHYLLENTVKGRVTYLTDFPLTHSHSSEHINNTKDLNAIKNERLAALRSTYLGNKQLQQQQQQSLRQQQNENEGLQSQVHDEKSGLRLSTFNSDLISNNDMSNGSEDELSTMLVNAKVPRPSSLNSNSRSSNGSSPSRHSGSSSTGPGLDSTAVKLRQSNGSNAGVSRSANRISTLQEDLIRLISPEYLSSPSPTKDNVELIMMMEAGNEEPILKSNGYNSSSCSSSNSNESYVNNSPNHHRHNNNNNNNNNISNSNGVIKPIICSNSNNEDYHFNNGGVVQQQYMNGDMNGINSSKDNSPADEQDQDWSDITNKTFQVCDDLDRLKQQQQHSNSPLIKSFSNSNNVGNGAWIESNNDNNRIKENGSPVQLNVQQRSELVTSPLLSLEVRVSQLEAELRKEQLSKSALAKKVANLQVENKRLLHESSTTQDQFNKFKDWLLNTVEPKSPSSDNK